MVIGIFLQVSGNLHHNIHELVQFARDSDEFLASIGRRV
jgi:hypothetical protein